MLTRPQLWTATLALAALIATGSARADIAMPLIRIGDIDGFGYGQADGFVNANGRAANRDGLGVLGDGDFLPDINRDGALRWGSRDDFDFRSPAEIAGGAIFAGSGVTNTAGTTGSQWTDIALSRSYDQSQRDGDVLVRNPDGSFRRGVGGAFPEASSLPPNQASFQFIFSVDKASLSRDSAIFFNLIFGDYDVTPASIELVLADNSTKTINLRTQGGNQDGLIQAAQADLSFADVFRDGGSVWNGSLRVNFLAPNEPFTSFDFVELSTTPILPVPEPSSVVMLGLGLGAVGLGVWRKARRAMNQ